MQIIMNKQDVAMPYSDGLWSDYRLPMLNKLQHSSDSFVYAHVVDISMISVSKLEFCSLMTSGPSKDTWWADTGQCLWVCVV